MTPANFVIDITRILDTFADCDSPGPVAQAISALASELVIYRTNAADQIAGRHASIAITALENACLFMGCKLPAPMMDVLTMDGGDDMQAYVRHELTTAALHIAQL
jgi:hypothetical protein